jgi:hypothetical protein
MTIDKGVTIAPASPAVRDRASFFPDPRRRFNASKKPLPAFQATASCPKPKARFTYNQYLGQGKDLCQRLTLQERRLIEIIVENADLIERRDVDEADTAFLLVSIPASLLEDLAAFRAGIEDFEEDADVETNSVDDDLCASESGDAFNWPEPTESGPQGPAVQENWAWGALHDDQESDAVEHMDQRHRCGREPDAELLHG